MSLDGFLSHLVRALRESGVAYMIVGSVAGSYHGRIRSTYDIDIVIDGDNSAIERLLSHFNSEAFYVSIDAVRQATELRSMFNIIDYSSGLKADLIFRKDRPFSREEFRRRQSGRIMGVEADVASPEDTILTKLEWSVMGNSARQVEDAIEIAKIANQQLDRNYLTYWADQLSLRPQLNEVLSQIEAPHS